MVPGPNLPWGQAVHRTYWGPKLPLVFIIMEMGVWVYIGNRHICMPCSQWEERMRYLKVHICQFYTEQEPKNATYCWALWLAMHGSWKWEVAVQSPSDSQTDFPDTDFLREPYHGLQMSHVAPKMGPSDICHCWGPRQVFLYVSFMFLSLTNCCHSFLGSEHVVTMDTPHPMPPLQAPAHRVDGKATTNRKWTMGMGNDRQQG